MTREEVVIKYRHELCGLIADAATSREQGGRLALLIRQWFNRVDEVIGRIHFDLSPGPPAAQANGNGHTNGVTKHEQTQRNGQAPGVARG